MSELRPLSELAKELQREPPYLMQHTLLEGGLSMMLGDPKSGKSTVARYIMRSVAGESPSVFGRKLKHGPVLYYVLEEILSEVVRSFKQAGATGLPIFIRHGMMAPDMLIPTMKCDVKATDAKLIVIDPMVDALGLEDLNDYGTVNTAMKKIVEYVRGTTTHIMFIHHTNKGSGLSIKSSLGSQALAGAVDYLFLMATRSDLKRTMHGRQRYGKEIPVSRVVLDENDMSITLRELAVQ